LIIAGQMTAKEMKDSLLYFDAFDRRMKSLGFECPNLPVKKQAVSQPAAADKHAKFNTKILSKQASGLDMDVEMKTFEHKLPYIPISWHISAVDCLAPCLLQSATQAMPGRLMI
jgi:hypothetical protein